MAASAPILYNAFILELGKGSFDLTSDTFKFALFTNSSNCTDVTQTLYSGLTNEVANGNGYLTGGATLGGVDWGAGATPSQIRFTGNALVFTASGGDIANVRYGVLYKSATSKLMMYWSLDSSAFSITNGSSITLPPDATKGFLQAAQV